MVEQARRRRLARHGEGEGGGGQLGAHVLAAVVGHAAARAALESEGEKEPAFGSFDIGKSALPHHARTLGRGHFGEPVFGDLAGVAAVCSPALPTPAIPFLLLGGLGPEAALLRGPQSLLAQEPPDPVLAAALAEFRQTGAHAQRPVSLAAARKARGDEARPPTSLPIPLLLLGGRSTASRWRRGRRGLWRCA